MYLLIIICRASNTLAQMCLDLSFCISTAQQSRITIGIAGPDIDNDAHPGHWNNTVGYHSDTGRCYTSHMDTANTVGEKFSIGKFTWISDFFVLSI